VEKKKFLGFWQEKGEGEKGKARRRGGLTVVKGESDLGLRIVLFILFLNQFGLVRFNRFKLF